MTASDDTPILVKRCSTCGETKPLTDFTPHKRYKYGVDSECKPCRSKRHNAQRARNPEAYRAAERARYAQHRDKDITETLKWRQQHREHYAEYITQYWRSFRQTPHGRAMVKAKSANQRARIYGATGRCLAVDIERQLQAQHNRCFWCGCELSESYQVDHRVPLSRGGSNAPSNICLTCAPCNMQKKDKLPSEWQERLP